MSMTGRARFGGHPVKSTNNTILILTIGTLAASSTWAQQTRPAAGLRPLVIADFERPESVALWTGLKCEATEAHASSGKHAMRFTFPKWEKGADEWPAVHLAFDGGKGYSTKDWSRFGKLAFDAWVEGSKAAAVSIELREKKGHNGPTTSFTIEPGKMNHGELPLADAANGIDLKNIEEFVLFASRPSQDETITIDSIRLLPGEKPPLAEFDLVYPNYRQMIFPDAGDPEIEVTVHAEEYGLRPDQLTARLFFAVGHSAPLAATHPLKQSRQRFSINVSDQPDGPGSLSVGLFRTADNVNVAGKEWPVQKVSTYQVSRLKVYIDRNNNTIVDGVPFFPLGWYDAPDEQHMAEIADSPFNCILDYGTNHKGKEWMTKYLDAMQRKGLKLIYCLNDVYPTATYFKGKSWEGSEGNENIADAVVRAYRDHPAILAWYLNDELPRKLVPQLEGYYNRVKSNDPNHPCYIVLCNMAEVKHFPSTTDVMGVDPYPIPRNPVTTVSQWMDTAMRAVNGHKPVWLVPQAFAWYQYNPEGSNRARKPTEAELKTGRAPTYEESRCMTYLALAHGAKGLIYYCYYDLRVLPQYAEMWGGMKKIGAEVKALSPVLLAPEDLGSATFSPADAPIHTKLKRCDNKLYLIAVNAANAPAQVTFDLSRANGLHGKPYAPPAQVEVVFENRKAPTDGAKLKAEFKPLEVHVYDLGPAGK
jgi:hypothetical protein